MVHHPPVAIKLPKEVGKWDPLEPIPLSPTLTHGNNLTISWNYSCGHHYCFSPVSETDWFDLDSLTSILTNTDLWSRSIWFCTAFHEYSILLLHTYLDRYIFQDVCPHIVCSGNQTPWHLAHERWSENGWNVLCLLILHQNKCLGLSNWICMLAFCLRYSWICVLNVHFKLIHILPFNCSNNSNIISLPKGCLEKMIYPQSNWLWWNV